MQWLVEDPTLILAAGALIEVLLAVVLFQTGRLAVIFAMVGVLVVVLLGVGVEWLVVTDAEQVEASLDGLATALEANDVQGVLAFIAPEADSIRGRASQELPRFQIQDIRLSDLNTTIHPELDPPQATVKLFARIVGKDRNGESPYDSVVRRFTLTFRLEGSRWLLASYDEQDITGQ